MSFAIRKRAELTAKLGSVAMELSRWQAESQPNGRLEKHQTQLRRLATTLNSTIASTQKALAADDAVASWMTIERQILGTHQVWDYFRSKLALRYVPWLADHLVAADDLAWACYQPACKHGVGEHNVALEAVREPPLVFFNSVATLFAVARGSALPTDDQGALPPERLSAAVQRLPIPVIGIPWYQVQHLPDAVIIAHEVGHTVEADFGLTARLCELVDGALAEVDGADRRRACWDGWIHEVFADVWGTLGAGSGFVSALLDFLGTPGSTPADPDSASDYPPSWLRAAIVCDVLRVTGGDASDGLWARAEADIPAPVGSDGWLDDAAQIAERLVRCTYPQFDHVALDEVLPPIDQTAAAHDAERLVRGQALRTADVRTLMSVAALAFGSDPQTFADKGLGAQVLARIVAKRASGPRETRARQPGTWKGTDTRDQAVGAELASFLAADDSS